MFSKTTLLACFIFLLTSCKEENKKKETIIGMDEEVDTIVGNFPLAKPDSVFRDTVTKRNVLDHDPVFQERRSAGKGANIPVFKSTGNLRQFIIEIKQLVAVNNKPEIAKRIKYPLNTSIKTISDFYANYDKLFTPLVKTSLKATDLDKLPRNQQTVMIANGKILIGRQGNDFKIIRINN